MGATGAGGGGWVLGGRLGARAWAWYTGLVRKTWTLLFGGSLAGAAVAAGATVEGYAKTVSSLVDPAKLADPGEAGGKSAGAEVRGNSGGCQGGGGGAGEGGDTGRGPGGDEG